MLNEQGYTDKFGEPLKEDGLVGGKTLYAFDKFDENDMANVTNLSTVPTARTLASKPDDNIVKPTSFSRVSELPKPIPEIDRSVFFGDNVVIKPAEEKTEYKPFEFNTNIREYNEAKKKYGKDNAKKAKDLSNDALKLAEKYAYENNMFEYSPNFNEAINGHSMRLQTWDNAADALRHMSWCSMMSRDISYEASKDISDNHEIEALRDMNFFSSNNNGIFKGKMNQATLMDIWNNKVGRDLASMPEFKHMGYEELFEYAKNKGYLITNAKEVYGFLGVENFITDSKNWAVTVEWDLEKDYITFIKGKGHNEERITLRMSPQHYN